MASQPYPGPHIASARCLPTDPETSDSDEVPRQGDTAGDLVASIVSKGSPGTLTDAGTARFDGTGLTTSSIDFALAPATGVVRGLVTHNGLVDDRLLFRNASLSDPIGHRVGVSRAFLCNPPQCGSTQAAFYFDGLIPGTYSPAARPPALNKCSSLPCTTVGLATTDPLRPSGTFTDRSRR
jgi:hypothetical protein